MYSISEYKISVLLLLSLAYSAISVFRRRHIVFLALSTCILSGSIRRTTTSVLLLLPWDQKFEKSAKNAYTYNEKH